MNTENKIVFTTTGWIDIHNLPETFKVVGNVALGRCWGNDVSVVASGTVVVTGTSEMPSPGQVATLIGFESDSHETIRCCTPGRDVLCVQRRRYVTFDLETELDYSKVSSSPFVHKYVHGDECLHLPLLGARVHVNGTVAVAELLDPENFHTHLDLPDKVAQNDGLHAVLLDLI